MTLKIDKISINDKRRLLFVSDIHGNLPLFKKLLVDVAFNDDDYLFILGDMIEKGDYNLEMLRYMMMLSKKENIFLIQGNNDQIMYQFDKIDHDLLKYYLFVKQKTILLEMALEQKFVITPEMDIDLFCKTIKNNYQKEINFIKNLPHVIVVNEKLYLSHAGIDDLNHIGSNDVCKNYAFFEKYLGGPHYQIVGHFPVHNYNSTKFKISSLIDQKRKIISIDAGCNVTPFKFLNVFIIDSLDTMGFNNMLVSLYPKGLIKKKLIFKRHSFAKGFRDIKDVKIIKKESDFYLIYCHGHHFYFPKKLIYSEQGKNTIYEVTNNLITGNKGDIIDIFLKGEKYSLVFKNGIMGIIENKFYEVI